MRYPCHWCQNQMELKWDLENCIRFYLAARAEQAEVNVEQVAVRGGWVMTCFRGSLDQVLWFSLLLYLFQPTLPSFRSYCINFPFLCDWTGEQPQPEAFWFHLFHPSIPFYFLTISEFHKGLIGLESDEWPGCRFLMFCFGFFMDKEKNVKSVRKQSKHTLFHVRCFKFPPWPPFRPLSLCPVPSLLRRLSEFISSSFHSLVFTSAPSHLAPFAEVMSSFSHHSQTSKEEKQ